MAYTTIDDPSAHFHAQLFTGDDNTDRAITNDAYSGDFKPDLLWLKNRDEASAHSVFDSSRLASSEATLQFRANQGNAEDDLVATFGGFETDGFTVDGSDSDTNSDGDAFVAWQWKANGGTTSSNTSGSITSTVQTNSTAGFSIITYSGNDTAGATIGHGLGAVPSFGLFKRREASEDWIVFHTSLNIDTEGRMVLNTTAVPVDEEVWNDTNPSSTLFTLGDNDRVNNSTGGASPYVAYVWTELQGYSKFGKYLGNNDADGTFVYIGFKPAWLMVKRTSDVQGWIIWDSKGDPFNVSNSALTASDTSSEEAKEVDLLSNGFKFRSADTATNAASTYIYMAFAAEPFVTSGGVPCTAR